MKHVLGDRYKSWVKKQTNWICPYWSGVIGAGCLCGHCRFPARTERIYLTCIWGEVSRFLSLLPVALLVRLHTSTCYQFNPPPPRPSPPPPLVAAEQLCWRSLGRATERIKSTRIAAESVLLTQSPNEIFLCVCVCVCVWVWVSVWGLKSVTLKTHSPLSHLKVPVALISDNDDTYVNTPAALFNVSLFHSPSLSLSMSFIHSIFFFSQTHNLPSSQTGCRAEWRCRSSTL